MVSLGWPGKVLISLDRDAVIVYGGAVRRGELDTVSAGHSRAGHFRERAT